MMFLLVHLYWVANMVGMLQMDTLQQIGVQFGFNALLVVALLIIQQADRKQDRVDREKDRRAINLLTRAVTEQTLAMAFLPKQFHEGARDIRSQMDAIDGEHK